MVSKAPRLMNCEWKRDDVYGNNIQVDVVGSANVG